MRAIWLENQTLSIRADLPVPQCADGEALVRVRLAGICGTDLELVRGYYPFNGILGHEFIGEVVDTADTKFMGKRVTGEINKVCGQCVACRRGYATHCEYRTTLGIRGLPGCFAEYLTLPTDNLHVIPDQLTDEIAVFTEPLAAALQILEQVHIHPSNCVLIVGAGRLGQLIAQTLALTGCDLNVVVRHGNQQRILSGQGIKSIMEDQVVPQKYDLVVDATGAPDGFFLAKNAVRPRGTLVLKSTYKGKLNFDFSSLVVDEITIVGSRCGPFEPALRLLNEGKIDPTPLITASYQMSDGISAIGHAAQSGVLKVLLEI